MKIALRLVAPLLLLLVLVTPARADLARPVHERRLANGLRVLVSPMPAAADVSVLVRYDVGARDEPEGLEGLAHLVEHLMFTGSKHAPRGRHAELLAQAGAVNVNATTSIDATSYFETLPPERLELALWLESDRMGFLADQADDTAMARVRAEVLNERRERVTEAVLGNVTGLLFPEVFPPWHPYDHVPIGTAASLAALTLVDARAFLRTWYGPGNAVLVITGKVDPPAAMALAERYFGTLPARPPPVRPSLPAIPKGATKLLYVGAAVTRAEVRVTWITPPYGARGDAELDMAAAILANGGVGWLERRLLEAPRRCTRVVAAQESMGLASLFSIQATIDQGRSAEEVIEVIHEELRRFDHAVTDADLRRARIAFYNHKLFSLESSLAWAGRLAADAAGGPLPAAYDGALSRYASIDTDDVRQAVREHLGGRPSAYVLARPGNAYPVAGSVIDAYTWGRR